MTSFIIVELSNFAYFVEHNISYQSYTFQLSRVYGSNFTEGWKTPPPPSVAPGEKSQVLLGLRRPRDLYVSLQNISKPVKIFSANLNFP